MRVGSPRSRPIGASIRPVRERGRPCTSAMYVRSNARSRTSSVQPLVRLLASARAPSGPTCRGRAGGRRRAASGSPPRDLRRRAHRRASRSRAPRPDEPRARPACRRRAGARPPRRSRAAGGAGRSGTATSSGSVDLLPALEPEALRARDRRRRARPPRPRARPLRANRGARRETGRAARPPPAGGTLHRAATSSVRRGGRGSRSAATSAASRIATPITMKLSARLNAGHQPQVDEVRDVMQPDPVDEVRDAAADQQPERRREHRVARARAREERRASRRRRCAVTTSRRRSPARRARTRCPSSGRGGS